MNQISLNMVQVSKQWRLIVRISFRFKMDEDVTEMTYEADYYANYTEEVWSDEG